MQSTRSSSHKAIYSGHPKFTAYNIYPYTHRGYIISAARRASCSHKSAIRPRVASEQRKKEDSVFGEKSKPKSQGGELDSRERGPFVLVTSGLYSLALLLLLCSQYQMVPKLVPWLLIRMDARAPRATFTSGYARAGLRPFSSRSLMGALSQNRLLLSNELPMRQSSQFQGATFAESREEE